MVSAPLGKGRPGYQGSRTRGLFPSPRLRSGRLRPERRSRTPDVHFDHWIRLDRVSFDPGVPLYHLPFTIGVPSTTPFLLSHPSRLKFILKVFSVEGLFSVNLSLDSHHLLTRYVSRPPSHKPSPSSFTFPLPRRSRFRDPIRPELHKSLLFLHTLLLPVLYSRVPLPSDL